MHAILPTCRFDSWTVTSLRDSFVSEIEADKSSTTLSLFFYAITSSGWDLIRKPLLQWKRANNARNVIVFVGTDHGITDPSAIESIQQADLDIRLMDEYRGVFHPKVIWLQGPQSHSIWVGSNNLTKDGLLNNIEFALAIKSKTVPQELARWAQAVESGSTPVTPELIHSYRQERTQFEKKLTGTKAPTFTWSKKHEPTSGATQPVAKGDLILEIMPEETRGGNQIQIPRDAARHFFGLTNTGDHKTIRLRPRDTVETRALILTVFRNNTIRLSINELEYGDRPCVMVFRKTSPDTFEFEIVSQSIFPTRYGTLLALCKRQTRAKSRRWDIVS